MTWHAFGVFHTASLTYFCLLLFCCACRHATWNGRLSDDAFAAAEGSLLDSLLALNPERQPAKTLNPALPSLNPTSYEATPQQQQGTAAAMVPTGAAAPVFAGAGAAAVEAAVAAINAAIAGTSTHQQHHQQQQSSLHPAAAADGGGGSSSRSFYSALMETGGILHPPGGPPIPLNVDFAKEIQPHLGRLLGRGGFGAVYEATWRGRKVSSSVEGDVCCYDCGCPLVGCLAGVDFGVVYEATWRGMKVSAKWFIAFDVVKNCCHCQVQILDVRSVLFVMCTLAVIFVTSIVGRTMIVMYNIVPLPSSRVLGSCGLHTSGAVPSVSKHLTKILSLLETAARQKRVWSCVSGSIAW
jgi:hypothetical protein